MITLPPACKYCKYYFREKTIREKPSCSAWQTKNLELPPPPHPNTPLTPQFYLIRERSGQITWDNTILTDLTPISFVLGGGGGGGGGRGEGGGGGGPIPPLFSSNTNLDGEIRV